jgi:HK97 gp10 family phage protein
MDGVFAKLFGAEKLKAKVKRIPTDLEVAMRSTMTEAAQIVGKEAERLIRGPKSGKVTRTKSGQAWRRSAPGEPPARGEGKLLNQIAVKKSNRALKPGARLVANVGYAKLLEYGTRKMAARPFFGPALRNKKSEINRRIKIDARRAVTKQAKR